MSIGSWYDNDGLLRQYGAQKANPTTGGDYLSYGDTREIEVTLTLANLTTTATLAALTTFIPVGVGQVFIEEVTYDTEVGMTVGTATAFSVGIGNIVYPATYSTIGGASLPAITTINDTAFINGALNATVTTAGQRTTLVTGSTGAGSLIGTASSATTVANYITAKSVGGTYTGGVVKVRIRYRGIGTITQ